jgi:CubicO group peptidase (beta-lactamase class C family)
MTDGFDNSHSCADTVQDRAVPTQRLVDQTGLNHSVKRRSVPGQMHFRSGAVAIAYLSTVLLKLVDQKVVSLDDKLSRWLPQIPNSNQITLGELAGATSGIADYVQNPEFLDAQTADVFRAWNQSELIEFANPNELLFPPGTSWAYSHTGFVILGQALEKATGKPLSKLMQDEIFGPLGLHDTQTSCTAQIQQPVLHAFSSDRGVYEDSTNWDPSWTLGCPGEVQTSNVSDLIKSAKAIGTGSLLSKGSHRMQIAPKSRITPPDGPPIYYGLGIFSANSWLYQNPLFSGYQAIMAYLPSKDIAIAVATTVGPQGSPDLNSSTAIFQKVAAYLAPNQAPPSL